MFDIRRSLSIFKTPAKIHACGGNRASHPRISLSRPNAMGITIARAYWGPERSGAHSQGRRARGGQNAAD
jgi:hypothetical protein